MALRIETFSNVKGGDAFFKAVGHPLAIAPARALIARLAARGKVAIYDPLGLADAFASLHDLAPCKLAGLFVQNIDAIGKPGLGVKAQPITDLPASGAASVLVLAFDAGRFVDHGSVAKLRAQVGLDEAGIERQIRAAWEARLHA